MGQSTDSVGGGVALIAGGSQGLGYAVAERLAAERAAGFLPVGRDPVKAVAAAASPASLDCRVEFLSADLSHSDACGEVVATLDERLGVCHSFVNCAVEWDQTVLGAGDSVLPGAELGRWPPDSGTVP